MHPKSLTLYVRDVPAAVAFYVRAFGLKQTFATDNDSFTMTDSWLSFVAVDAGGSLLETDLTLPDNGANPQGVEFGFECADVEDAYRRAVDAGAKPFQTPSVRPWGQTVAYVRDPDGHLICICTPFTPEV